MNKTIKLILIIISTLLAAFIESLLLELDLVASHWSRQLLVLILMALSLILGGFMAVSFIKGLETSKN